MKTNKGCFLAGSYQNNTNLPADLITEDQLKKIYPYSSKTNRDLYLPYLNKYFHKYGVDTFERICAFLAQVGHESGQLKYVEEIASGKAYDTGSLAVKLGNTPEPDGDGQKYKGKGLIQVTGKTNYQKFTNWCIGNNISDIDFVKHPEMLKEPEYAVLSAFWYWSVNILNRYATLKEDDFRKLTKVINGGLNGYADRKEIWDKAKDVLK
ncbi:glycoside hydrolase family 19 protein [Dysgonomonas macrotermitis]|uniref:Putative chitinase n=1 Tax=Dysgonomonas macrotermitis TaxID=1346286 RepID=A0A1M4UIF0_9BACT|nr:glycoside hydrolase family 19 protein [Dysgonomonas macrotermitis]SHE56340.1 putative chitinase [Dysgonomonas macrotermitis]